MRKRCHRKPVQPLPPRGMRAKMTRDDLLTTGIAHMQLLDDIASGRGTEETLWNMAGQAVTWSRVAHLLKTREAEMVPQLEMAAAVIERYGRTGKVGFSGPEYQRAKEGVAIMDELAALVHVDTAQAAARWAEKTLNGRCDAGPAA